MNSVLLDVNVLLALAWPNHQHHRAAHAWFARRGAPGWATCALTQLAFVRLSANPAYTTAAVSPPAAAALLRRMTEHPGHRYWESLPEPSGAVFEHALGHQQVMDAYLVSVAGHHGGRIATFDRAMRSHAPSPEAVEVIGV